jgi:CHAP domain
MSRARHISLFVALAAVALTALGLKAPVALAAREQPGLVAVSTLSSKVGNILKYPCQKQAPFGSVLIPASAWAGSLVNTGHDGATFTVYSNYRVGRPEGACAGNPVPADGTNQWGLQYQCTELAVRVADAEWGIGNDTAWKNAGWNGAADTMKAPGQKLGLTWTDNGTGSLPAPGDLMIWSSSGGNDPGHVGVVSSVGSGTVTFVGENQSYGMVTLPVNGTKVDNNGWKTGKTSILGWLSHGSSWKPIQMPMPSGAAANPGVRWASNSLVCPSTTACVAEGTYRDSSGSDQGFLVTGSGTTWTAAKAPLPAGAISDPNRPEPLRTSLTSAACPSAGECVAIGQYEDSSGNTEGMLLTGSGTTWTATEAPLPGDAINDPGSAYPFRASLASVACPSASECVAVGEYQDSSGQYQGFLVTGSGTTWTATKAAPLPDGASAYPDAGLSAVSCASATACVAIGSYLDSSGQFQGLLLTGSGTTWGATRAASPSGAAYPLDSVACASGMPCVVVGSYWNSANTSQPVLLTWSGTTWIDAEPQLPADASTYGTVFQNGYATCPSATTCVVAGSYEGGDKSGVLLTGSGTKWTTTEAPATANAVGPTGAHTGSFMPGSVACPSTTQCVAAGSYDDSSFQEQGMLLTGSATTWAATEAPLPGGIVSGDLYHVACASATQCVVGGTYYGPGDSLQGLLLIGPG